MIADIEKPDGTYERREMGDPLCGEAFCDTCGDCLHCYAEDCYNGSYCGAPRWVIYIESEKNPYHRLRSDWTPPI